MTDKRLTMVLDYNNLAFRSIYSCTYSAEANVSNFDTKDECNVFARKLTTDICYIVKSFNPDRVVIACDAKEPWRRSLYKPSDGAGYKGTRQKDDSKNWGNIHNTMAKLADVFKKNGFIISDISGAEADDMAALWKEHTMAEGGDIVLVSSDKDWQQLAEFNENTNQYCVCYNPIVGASHQKKIFVPQSLYDILVGNRKMKTDIFFNGYNPHVGNIMMAQNISSPGFSTVYSIIDPEHILLEKIMCGDDGDNVPAIYEFYKNGKKTRVTPLKCGKICESLGASTVKELVAAAADDTLKKSLETVFKRDIDDADINEHMIRQRQLVELKSILFPQEIVDKFEAHYGKVAAKAGIAQGLTMQTVLAGTEFLDENYNKPKENAIFDELNGLEHLFDKHASLF